MISLSNARHLVEEVKGENLVYTDLTLSDWAKKGIISNMKVNNGNYLYPDIVAIEILTAINLKEKYNLSKIAKARSCLELEGDEYSEFNKITEAKLMKFINCKKLVNDKKLVTELAISQIEFRDKIKELRDDMHKEKEYLEVVEDYLKEFLQAEKEINNVKENRKRKNIS